MSKQLVRPRVRDAGKGHTVKLDLVPLNDGALNLEKRQADRRLPVLRALENQVVERVTDLAAMRQGTGVSRASAARVWFECRGYVFCPAYASGKWYVMAWLDTTSGRE